MCCQRGTLSPARERNGKGRQQINPLGRVGRLQAPSPRKCYDRSPAKPAVPGATTRRPQRALEASYIALKLSAGRPVLDIDYVYFWMCSDERIAHFERQCPSVKVHRSQENMK